jgi:CheY-like chemotaxis protein
MANCMPVVYVVDDEKVIAETLAQILNQAGFIAFAFEDASQVLAAVAAGSSPNLLISDVMMPGISGIELAIQFQQICPRCRILLLSGQIVTASLLELARSHGYDFELIPKPIHPRDLLARLYIDPEFDRMPETLAHETPFVPVER